MSKKTLKVTFEYGDVTYRLEWKGHPYCQTSVCDFLNAFVGMLELGLEVRERPPVTSSAVEKQEQFETGNPYP